MDHVKEIVFNSSIPKSLNSQFRFIRVRLLRAFFVIVLCCSVAELAAGAERPTTADDYKKKYSKVKHITVKLPSGAVFRLRSIDQRTINRLLAQMDISLTEYDKLVNKKFDKMSLKEISRHTDFWDAIIVQSVEEPKMCIEPEEGRLEVRLLTPEDMDKLQEEIGKLRAGIPDLPMKPLSASPPRSEARGISVSRLLLNPDKYEGKHVDIHGEVERELGDIGIITRQAKSIILQRFYISDGKKGLLVLRFYSKGDRIFMDSILRDIVGKGDDKVNVNIKKGKFTTKLIDEPTVITHSKNIDKVKTSWLQIALQNMKTSK